MVSGEREKLQSDRVAKSEIRKTKNENRYTRKKENGGLKPAATLNPRECYDER